VANNRKPQDNNAPATDELRGGTQGGGTGVPVVSNTPGGTNALSPTGAARPIGATPEPPTGDREAANRQDPQRIDDRPTRPSESAAKQWARDEANVQGSHSGIDEGNPRQIPENAPTPDGRTGND
jgi:hypothetical protein